MAHLILTPTEDLDVICCSLTNEAQTGSLLPQLLSGVHGGCITLPSGEGAPPCAGLFSPLPSLFFGFLDVRLRVQSSREGSRIALPHFTPGTGVLHIFTRLRFLASVLPSASPIQALSSSWCWASLRSSRPGRGSPHSGWDCEG